MHTLRNRSAILTYSFGFPFFTLQDDYLVDTPQLINN